MIITFSANNRQEIRVLPLCPVDLPIEYIQNNTIYDGLSFPLAMVGNVNLRELAIDTILPCRRQSWQAPGSTAKPKDYVEFFKRWQSKKVPIRIVVSDDDGSEYLNMACLINSCKYYKEKCGDYKISIALLEYPFVTVKRTGVKK